MLIRNATTMLNLIYNGLTRLLPDTAPARPDDAWVREASSCYDSRFDLARGLEVIEHRGTLNSVFSDTQPAYHWPRA